MWIIKRQHTHTHIHKYDDIIIQQAIRAKLNYI